MLKSKKSIDKLIKDKCAGYVTDQNLLRNLATYLNLKYNYSIGKSMDTFTLRTNPEDLSDNERFWILDALFSDKVKLREIENNRSLTDEVNIIPSECYEYFAEAEIKMYSSSKFEKPKINFPIRWKMIQISDDQFIGSISVKDLILLRDAQLINYNTNAQRILQKKVTNGYSYLTIHTNRSAIEQISKNLNDNTFIPNTLTLNIPSDYENESYYDTSTGELVINNIKCFDILDGYHRYISISNVYNANNDFNFTMELRVVKFDDSRARQFIHQEDQKTKMSKIESASLNSNSDIGKILERLKKNNYFGSKISRSDGCINELLLYQILQLLYTNSELASLTKDVMQQGRIISEQIESLLSQFEIGDNPFENKWTNEFTISAFYVLFKEPFRKGEMSNDKLEKVRRLEQDIITSKTILNYNSLSKRDITRLDKLYAKGESNEQS